MNSRSLEVIPVWLNGVGFGQKGERWIVNPPSFGHWNVLSRTADVCHPEQSTDRDRHRSDASSVLANISYCTETERTKATVVRFELLLELTASTPLDSVFISHSSNDKDFSRPSL